MDATGTAPAELAEPAAAAAPLLTPQQALGLEQDLLARVSRGEIDLGWHCWHTTPALFAPRALAPPGRFAAAAAGSAARGWPVVVRASGGDLVPQAPGLLNLSLVWRQAGLDASLAAAYERLGRPLLAGLAAVGLRAGYGTVAGAFCDGRYNLVVAGRKIAGTAQRWKIIGAAGRQPRELAVLAHAVLLVETDLEPLVASVNAFYRACGMARRCRADAHTTVAAEHRRATGRTWHASDRHRLMAALTMSLGQDTRPLAATIGG